MRKTKIICTIGPASSSVKVLEEMARAGMNVARINMSHGTQQSHQEIIDNLNFVRIAHDKPIALMCDTKGPEIRIGKFEKGEVILKPKKAFTLTSRDVVGNENIVSLVYKRLVKEVKVGDKIYANNGLVVLRVKEITETDIKCKVLFGGKLTNNKGLNIPGIVPEGDYISEADKKDLLFAIKNNADFIAASFVSSKQDVLALRKFLADNGGKDIKIISKIENSSGIKNINEIIDASDGVMVARGDLGVEIPLEKLPSVQKKLISKCLEQGKLVIVATEMLESMTSSVRPTRAEVSDVANAIYEKATATMLSGETAVGKHPALVVKTMAKILVEAEKHINYNEDFISSKRKVLGVSDSICKTTCQNAISVNAKLIVVFTSSGNTAHLISSNRVSTPILAITPNQNVYNSLALSWNTIAYKNDVISSEKEMLYFAENTAKTLEFVRKNDIIVVTTGTPEVSGQTNMLKIIKI
ncbi:MAG TPA: pyruvate kinase [Candidatus Caccopulliclostridium gallistercoris]|uniref:Pyruvate kinase n=1 Tax=Candidatus Caccopulliclostridium gallistercoris TaxID=2840719 RepID=A0A9D1NE57_9FIRM|nr:pyruvate kinase [Candidatus Caccopulliclostridium gallistercoris]